MKITVIAALSIATAATALPLAPTANAGPIGAFQSPSGNIACILNDTGAACQVHRHTYAVPAPEQFANGAGEYCHLGGWGSEIDLEPGSPPHFECVGGVLAVPPMPTLDYGQTRSAGTIACNSEPSGMTCTDSSTGHFFRLSGDSYQLG